MADEFKKALETEATAQLEAITQYRTNGGDQPDLRSRAKVALGVIGAYVRFCATPCE